MRRIGIIGGGQLGRMAIEEAGKYGARVAVLTPEEGSPGAELAAEARVGSLADFDAMVDFGRRFEAVSYEIEHVNVAALRELERLGVAVLPGAAVLELIQDKGAQKELWAAAGLPQAAWAEVPGLAAGAPAPGPAELAAAAARVGGFPAIQKSRRGGYDGKGVRLLASAEAEALPGPSFLEERIDFAKELAVVVARGPDGAMAAYPCVEMVFDERANLCDSVLAPAQASEAVRERARELALACVEALDRASRAEGRPGAGAVGVFGVEMFLTRDGRVLVNEVAPRPHNSGHFTIEASASSQFDQYLRILLGLPLGSAELLRPAMMINLVGEPGASGEPEYAGLEAALAVPGVAVHLYGKREVRPFRKMGHLTAVGATAEEAMARARAARAAVRVVAR
ncbi:MAG: 5-(carboxyamino)imidazole ribonucleotide synthase [Spirochaetaceae bacterium]|nr:5-(carboxyamino)imidazole ribonucleotide synthase [Spirochaetaceae bacterium]